MPEISEVRIMSEYINAACGEKIFSGCSKNHVSKNAFDPNKLPKRYTITSVSRGKELQIHHHPVSKSPTVDKSPVILTITMGMSGSFLFQEFKDINRDIWEERPKWPMLSWHGKFNDFNEDFFVLDLIDHRRFAKWDFRPWNPDRGPDFVTEHEEFKEFILKCHKDKDKRFKMTLCDILMDQRYFNGLGNYLRAEILGRLNVNPFQAIQDLSVIDLKRLIELCKTCAEEAYLLGGGQLRDWNNPNEIDKLDFSTWMKVYKKPDSLSVDTKGGRTFWFDKKWENHNTYA